MYNFIKFEHRLPSEFPVILKNGKNFSPNFHWPFSLKSVIHRHSFTSVKVLISPRKIEIEQ